MPSTVIRAYSYESAKRELAIVFQSGRRYVYREVPAAVFSALKAAPSKGEFFNHHIRDKFAFVRDDDRARLRR